MDGVFELACQCEYQFTWSGGVLVSIGVTRQMNVNVCEGVQDST